MDMHWIAVAGGALTLGGLHLRGLLARGQFLPAYRRREAREALAEMRGALQGACSRPLQEGRMQATVGGLLSELESGLPLRGGNHWDSWREALRVVYRQSVGGGLEADLTRAMRAAEEVELALARVVASYP